MSLFDVELNDLSFAEDLRPAARALNPKARSASTRLILRGTLAAIAVGFSVGHFTSVDTRQRFRSGAATALAATPNLGGARRLHAKGRLAPTHLEVLSSFSSPTDGSGADNDKISDGLYEILS